MNKSNTAALFIRQLVKVWRRYELFGHCMEGVLNGRYIAGYVQYCTVLYYTSICTTAEDISDINFA